VLFVVITDPRRSLPLHLMRGGDRLDRVIQNAILLLGHMDWIARSSRAMTLVTTLGDIYDFNFLVSLCLRGKYKERKINSNRLF
jgi:hypothetical protein